MIVMDRKNLANVKRSFGAAEGKTFVATDWLRDLDYAEVPDPWYTGDFQETYAILCEALPRMFEDLVERGTLGPVAR